MVLWPILIKKILIKFFYKCQFISYQFIFQANSIQICLNNPKQMMNLNSPHHIFYVFFHSNVEKKIILLNDPYKFSYFQLFMKAEKQSKFNLLLGNRIQNTSKQRCLFYC